MNSKKILQIAKTTREASYSLSALTPAKKNKVLKELARELIKKEQLIIKANEKDVKLARKKGLNEAMIDRLGLDKKRIKGMSEAVHEIAALNDPVGEVVERRKRGGLRIRKVRIPLGVICMIYESRPNVTVDAASLCFKSGNAVVLRGGSEAFESNSVLVKIIAGVLKKK